MAMARCPSSCWQLPFLLLLALLLLARLQPSRARSTHFSDGDEVPVYANKVRRPPLAPRRADADAPPL